MGILDPIILNLNPLLSIIPTETAEGEKESNFFSQNFFILILTSPVSNADQLSSSEGRENFIFRS